MVLAEGVMDLGLEVEQPDKKKLPTVIVIEGTASNVHEIVDEERIYDRLRRKTGTNELYYELINSGPFLSRTTKFVEEKLSDIFNEPNIQTFDTLSYHINLLGLGKHINVFSEINAYKKDELILLCKEYIRLIVDNRHNQQKFDIYFNAFICLIRSINSMCVLDQVNTYRKRIIPDIVDVLEKSISELIFKLENLNGDFRFSDKKHNDLLYFSGILKVNFEITKFIDVDKLQLDEIVPAFLNLFSEMDDGYQSAKKSNFRNNLSRKSVVDNVFVLNYTYLLSLLIYKLKSKTNNNEEVLNNILNTSEFKIILEKFGNFFGDKLLFLNKSLDDLQNVCNNLHVSVYDGEKKFNTSDKEADLISLLDSATLALDNHNLSDKIESIHNLILFNDFSEDILLSFLKKLLNMSAYKGYNLEFSKLKIIDVILNKLEKNNKEKRLNEKTLKLLESIVEYIDNNKIASPLLFAYSELYLTMAFICVKDTDNKFQKLAIEFFLSYKSINLDLFSELEYKYNLDDFYLNIGIAGIKNGFEGKEDDLDVTDESIIVLGKKIMNRNKEAFKVSSTSNIYSEFNTLIMSDPKASLDESYLITKLTDLVSKEVFNGVTKMHLINNKIEKSIFRKENGFGYKKIDLHNGYFLVFEYPNHYKEIFENIYNTNIGIIEIQIKGLLSWHISMINLGYKDNVTGLGNEAKLRTILTEPGINTTNLLAVKLPTLSKLNTGYGSEVGDSYLIGIIELLKNSPFNDNIELFRLSGAKIGILLKNELDYKKIISYLDKKSLPLSVPGLNNKIENFKVECIYGLVINNGLKSIEMVYSALREDNGTNIKIHNTISDTNLSKQSQENLLGLHRLNEALENDKLTIYFQPIYDIVLEKITKYECLLRGIDGGNVHLDYLQTANEYGKLLEIAKKVIPLVFKTAILNKEIDFSFNLSGNDLLTNEISILINSQMEKYGLNKIDNLVIEILEGEWSNEYTKIKKTILELKVLGFKVAIDDYGSEHSNLNRLNELFDDGIPDILKIDSGIIKRLQDQDIKKSKSAESYIKNIIEIAKIYGVKVVAEYVDNKEVLDKLNILGVHYAQGYYIGKPKDELLTK